MSEDKVYENITAEEMALLSQLIAITLSDLGYPKLGFCIITFPFTPPGEKSISSYGSNANTEDLGQYLFETAFRMKNDETFPIKES